MVWWGKGYIVVSALKPVVIMGGWGSAQIVTSVLEDINRVRPEWELLGYLNDFEDIGAQIGDYKVIGRTEQAKEYADKNVYLHYAMRNPKYAKERIARFREMAISDECFATFIHPTAHTAGGKGVGYGSLMAPFSMLSFGAQLGNHNHVYGAGFIGHDTIIEDYAWIANNAALGARCVIGEGSHMGTNCCTREDIKVGAYALVGIGSVVIKDVADGEVVAGNPAKRIGMIDAYSEKA